MNVSKEINKRNKIGFKSVNKMYHGTQKNVIAIIWHFILYAHIHVVYGSSLLAFKDTV